MRQVELGDLDIFDVGNEVQIYGAIYSGKGRIFFIPLPDEDPQAITCLSIDSPRPVDLEPVVLQMGSDDMAKFLNQTDVLDIRGEGKAILRKSQRQVDANVSWAVFRRDGYACRYCGRDDVPLTVDHVDPWELGGATVEANLVSACRRCNKLRGNRSYPEWIASADYATLSRNLVGTIRFEDNLELVEDVPYLQTLRVQRRSR